MNRYNWMKKVILVLIMFCAAAYTNEPAASAAGVELKKVQLYLRLQPYESGQNVVTDPKAFNQLGNQEFPNMIDGRSLAITQDGSFSYSGPTSSRYGNKNRQVKYSGRLDLDKWTFKVSGSWNGRMGGNGGFGAYLQEDSGEFTVEGPICAQDESMRASIRITGSVKTYYRDEKNGIRSQQLPLTTQTKRRLTDDIRVCVYYKDTEFLKPEYKNIGGPEMYATGEELTREVYRKITGKR